MGSAVKSLPLHERDFTLRVSELPSLGRCPGFMLAQIVKNRNSKAADTGSFVGKIIQLFHEMGEDPIAWEAARRQAVIEAAVEWPQADIEDGTRNAFMYCMDSRNRGVVQKGSCEMVVRVHLDPAPEDPTQKPIILEGHVDQLRRDKAGRLSVWDTKNSELTGRDLMYGYAWQVSAYALGATAALGRPVQPGGIIKTTGYPKKLAPEEAHLAPGVFFSMPWTLDHCRSMMQTVAQHMAMLRSGLILTHPGSHCVWCPGEGPHLCEDFIADAYPNGVVV